MDPAPTGPKKAKKAVSVKHPDFPSGSIINPLTGNYEKKGNVLCFEASPVPKAIEDYETYRRAYPVCLSAGVS